MLTFTMLWKESAAAMGLSSNDPYIPIVKRNVNNGLKLMKSAAQQYWTRKEIVADLVAGQQYYTLAADTIRPRNLRINNGSLIFPIPSVESENEWNALNIIPQFAIFYPQRWFVRGPNEIGVWPVPSTNISGALIVAYDSRLEDMYLDDTVGGSVTVTQGSTVLTGTGFTPNMVGMKLGFTDGSDGNWYSIIGYTNSTTMTLENFYPKTTQTTNATVIGSCPDIPEEYHVNLEDYALYRYYKLKRINVEVANDYRNDFLAGQEGYLGTFSDKESSQIISPRTNILSYNPLLVPPINLQG
jgi:hypothetical protein